MDKGASLRDRVCAPTGLSRDASQAEPLVPSAWRIAVINHEKNPCAIIRDNGAFGDEFVASDISIADARIFAALGVRDELPSTLALGGFDETDWHVLAQDIAGYWSHPEERAVAYQAAGEAIKVIRAAQAMSAGTAETLQAAQGQSPASAVAKPCAQNTTGEPQ